MRAARRRSRHFSRKNPANAANSAAIISQTIAPITVELIFQNRTDSAMSPAWLNQLRDVEVARYIADSAVCTRFWRSSLS